MFDVLKCVDFKKESQEGTLKTCYKVLDEVERIIQTKERNTDNTKLQKYWNNRLKEIRKIYMRMVYSLSGWMNDDEVAHLIYNFNKLVTQ